MVRSNNIQILYSDNHLIAVSKPVNVIVQGDKTGDESLLEITRALVKKKFNKPGNVFLGLVHRLDRPVSGVVVFARTSKALARMNKLFADRKVKKHYLAIVGSRPQEFKGTLTHYITKDEKKNKVSTSKKQTKGSKEGILEYSMRAEVSGRILLDVYPKTGRSHQIRAQLGYIKCPIVGDLKYNYPHPTENKSICLHCRSLSFIHPVTLEPIKIKAGRPNTIPWSLFPK